jgi:hypothetical protein
MKSNIKLLTVIFILALAGIVEVANAFYDPGLQRWINRDPLGDAKSTPGKGSVRGIYTNDSAR